MSELNPTLDTLKQKIDQLITSHSLLSQRLKDTEAQNADLKNQLVNYKDLHKDGEDKNKIHNLAQSISGNTNSVQSDELKLIITDLVKEIDKCISLLGKNV